MFAQFLARARLAVAVAFLATASANADPITFDFNSLSGGGNAAVQGYFDNFVSVSAGTPFTATVTGAAVQSTYTGDGYVVGPVSGSTVRPMTLGTSDGMVMHSGFDSFLSNDAHAGSKQITIVFSKPVYSVAFDWEIFPDGTGVWPDLRFDADGTTIRHWWGEVGPNGYLYSPNSISHGVQETNKQGIGFFSTVFPNGVTKLEFIDWPRMIAIDNLTVNFGQQPAAEPTPEPATVLVWGLGLGAVGVAGLRRAQRGRAVVA